ncbi:hypothetical protein D3C81_1784600 [compost metagenome]
MGVGFARQSALGLVGPSRQAHVILGGVGPRGDDLGGGVTVRGPVNLILNRLEE